ncbi:MAG: YegS/Rv2252/BmrU family lipid kinase [Bacteroidales bacterium]|nr:YegS/Rv2252/BmrU family lipid kinase [Bacteroidales bacterium]
MKKFEDKDILFIINPNSGHKKSKKIAEKISGLGISYVITANETELEKVFEENIENFKIFIVAGGDGTVNEAIKYLYNRNDKLLGIFPAGSGDGFARELGFKKNIKSLICDAKKGDFLFIDLLSINNNLCINIAGIGFDSYVAHNFQKKEKRGLKSYISTVIKAVFSFKPFNAEINIGNEKITEKLQMITIANTGQFGNNAIISPQSKPNDNFFELVLVKPFPFFIYPVFVFRLFFGLLKNSKYMKFIKVKDKIEIKTDFNLYHTDGEPKSFEKELFAEMLQNKIRIIKTKHCKL